jgi:hypothetical protein
MAERLQRLGERTLEAVGGRIDRHRTLAPRECRDVRDPGREIACHVGRLACRLSLRIG